MEKQLENKDSCICSATIYADELFHILLLNVLSLCVCISAWWRDWSGQAVPGRSQVGALVQQMSCKAVPERVRRCKQIYARHL